MDLPLDADLRDGTSRRYNSLAHRAAMQHRAVTSLPAYLCGRALQRVVVQDDGLQLGQAAVADGDGGHFVAGEVEAHQRKLGQL